ncbi:MAG: albusnodin/ikarugamycin family macrolactam cyclase [Pseudonocardiaceae bacterium]
MRWFGGCEPRDVRVVPADARVVWNDPPLWTIGNWAPQQVRTAESGGARIAVFGSCSANENEIAYVAAASDLAGLATWAGSFTVVRVNSVGTVEIVTDAAGACPVYTAKTPTGLVWGSSSRALSGLTGRRVDTEWLAAYLVDKQTATADRSTWVGVVPVPAGHRLVLRPNRNMSVLSWWSRSTRDPDSALKAIRRALAEGVRVRLESVPSSADLAGLDSTTLALIAAQYGPITGMTAHPASVGRGGDLDYARALNVPGLSRMFLPLEAHHLPFTPTDEPMPPTDEPAPSAAVWAMFSAQLRASAAAGHRRHLTGDGGDNLFLAPPIHLIDLARTGRWLRLARDAQDWARLRRQSSCPLIWAAMRRDVQRVARPWATTPGWLATSVPTPALPASSADDALIAEIRSVARAAYADIQLADSLGIELNNPYFDGAMLDAVISLPAWRRFSARRYKPVLVDAFGDMLPEAHRLRATKGIFVSDFHLGIRANLRRVLDLADGRLAAAGLVDPAPLRATVHAAALGADTVWSALLPTLAAEMWLDAIEQAPATEWTTATRAGAA